MVDSEETRRAYLAALGIEVWERRDPSVLNEWIVAPVHESIESITDTVPQWVEPTIETTIVESKPDWATIEQAVKTCTACPLHKTRTQAVFGVGDRSAQWFIVGEAPGAEEDRKGEPFVGAAGQLLDQMMSAIGLKREEVYIANVLKSRPSNNRTPLPEEIKACRPYLESQIALIAPKILLAVGAVAAQTLLSTQAPIGTLRDRVYRYGPQRIPLVVTYHPAYLLRNSIEKRKTWSDLRLAWRVFHQVPPDGQDR